MKKIVVISAHPDDETLGVGGTILRHSSAGDSVFWLIVTNISTAQGFDAQKVEERQIEIDTVSKQLGITKVFKLDYPTMQLTSHDLLTLVPKIAAIFNEVKPQIIYSLNRSDAHSDHRIIFDATMACTKSFRHPYLEQILMYECISETEFAPALPEKVFQPNYFVNISEFLDEKLEVMSFYKSELGNHPFPRSLENIKALAHFRGASIGVKYAEAFQLLKFIVK